MKGEATLLYDGECPICSRYSDYIRLRERYDLQLLDARQHLDLVERYRTEGYDIERGMILTVGGEVFHGHRAIVMLETMTGDRTVLDPAIRATIRVPGLMRAVYPLVKLVRVATLLAKRVSPRIRDADRHKAQGE